MQFITISARDGAPCLTRKFTARDGDKARLKITGLGLYLAFLNGEKIGDRYLTPGFNDYDAYLRVQEYELKSLVSGKNVLSVLLGDGWYKGRFGLDAREKIWGERYLMAAELAIIHEDGRVETIRTDESWQGVTSGIVQNSIYDGEVRNDLQVGEEIGSCEVVPCEYSMEMDQTPPIRVKEVLKPRLLKTPKGEAVLDFGQNFAGILRFWADMQKGARVRFLFGEILVDGCFCRENLRGAKAEYVYVSDGRPKWVEPYFTYYGFRYVKVEGMEVKDVGHFEGRVLSTDLPELLKVRTDNPKLNRLFENALWGQRSNFMDIPTDCPQRDERLGWTADARVFAGTAFYQMDCKEFYRKFMRDMRIDQERYFQGNIPAFSPSLKGASIPGGAGWADAAVTLPWDVYMQYGDVGLLEENYPMMSDYVSCIEREDLSHGCGHVMNHGFTFGDWLALDGITEQSLKGGTDDTYIRTAFYYHCVEIMASAAKVLGYGKDMEHWEKLAGEIREAFLDEYQTPKGRLSVNTQTGYILALSFGLYRNREVMAGDFAKKLKRDKYRISCGFIGTPLLLPVLFDNGLSEIAFRMLYNEEYPGWLYEVNLGATTIWERWNSVLPDKTLSGTGMNSLNHYAYGSVCEAVYSRIAGLRARSPGWRKAILEPHFNWRMKELEMAYDSPAGRFEVGWRALADDKVEVCVRFPEGTSTEIRFPGQKVFSVGGGSRRFEVLVHEPMKHPFGTDTVLADLLRHEAARQVLMERLADLYPVLEASEELQPFSLLEIKEMNPNLAALDLEPVGRALRSVLA